MQTENLSQSHFRFGLISSKKDLMDQFKNSDIQIEPAPNVRIDILALDLRPSAESNSALRLTEDSRILSARKIILIHEQHQQIPVDLFSIRRPDLLVTAENLNLNTFLKMDEDLNQSQQDLVYLNLSSELNSEYEILKNELETKIADHQKSLIESRQKILDANNRSEALRKILYALHQESDIARIETLLNELLPTTSNATWIKLIQNSTKDQFELDLNKQLGLSFQSYGLPEYLIYFIKGDQKSFKKTDYELFQKIRDALVLNLTRNQNLSELVLAEEILTEAFKSFLHPLAIIAEDYTVLKANPMFQKYPRTKCYEMLFNLDSPCLGCRFGQKFNVEFNTQTYDKKTFEVTSNAYSSDSAKKNIWVHTYIDRTEEIYLEQRITQNAKMKDLGLISSSIAHELNNPLGGIISYLQILQMEISKESPLQTDLQAMVQTSFKMKKIIEDLLVFSRRPQIQNKSEESLMKVVTEFLSENELTLKSANIKIVLDPDSSAIELEMSKTAFKDSLYFIFQFFIDRAGNIRKQKQNFTGLVEIKFFQDALKSTLRFVGNFGPLENDYKLKNVQFLAIHKTLLDQGFHVELTEPDKTWVAIDITFTRS